jgi:predicted helicase
MRWHLMQTFDKIYILNLHGDSQKHEKTPDGQKDENIFDIKKGVAIVIFIKTPKQKQQCQCFYKDIWGTRDFKNTFLETTNLISSQYNKIIPDKTHYFFVPKIFEDQTRYKKGFEVTNIFNTNFSGMVSAGDNFIIDFDCKNLKDKILDFISKPYTNTEFKNKYGLGKNYPDYVLLNKPKLTFDDHKLIKIAYRPFDNRNVYYDHNVLFRSKSTPMQNIINHPDNWVLMLCKQTKSFTDWHHVLITNQLFDSCLVSDKTSETSYGFPLNVYFNGQKQSNLNPDIVHEIESKVGQTTPESIFDYIYGILHSPSYREKYREFLKIDFPRIPYPENKDKFEHYRKYGEQLRKLHLMTNIPQSNVSFPMGGNCVVDKPTYDNGRVYINEMQYFDNVPQTAWEFYIGGYQPAQKYLKDRKGRALTQEEVMHYENIITVLQETDRIMKEIG